MSTPSFSNYAAIGGPNGISVKPGGRVAAYVRSIGAQEGDDLFAGSGLLVSTINAGMARCRAGFNDIVYVLPGHTETFSATGAIWTPVAGAQIIGAGRPGASNNPTITLSHVGASVTLSAAGMTVSGLNIVGASVLTAGVVISAAGCAFTDNYCAPTGALAANSFILISSAPSASVSRNHIIVDSTATIVSVIGATSTNFLFQSNIIRQTQATSGGAMLTTASTTGISGFVVGNWFKTASTVTAGVGALVLGANTITTVANIENYAGDETAAAGLLMTGA